MGNKATARVNISGGLNDALHGFLNRILAGRWRGALGFKLGNIIVEQDLFHLLLEPKSQGFVVGEGRSHFFHQGVV